MGHEGNSVHFAQDLLVKVDVVRGVKGDAALFGDAFADGNDIEVGKDARGDVVLGDDFFFGER